MPFTAKPTCASCGTKSSNIWRKGGGSKVYCSRCAKKELDGVEGSVSSLEGSNGGGGTNSNSPPATKTGSSGPGTEWPMTLAGSTRSSRDPSLTHYSGPLRKSARIKPSKYKHQPMFKTLATKGKSRRVVFKKNPIKAPAIVSTVVTSDYIFYEGQYWQVGDIASVLDDDDGGVYYVQLRGFLQDQYCDKSAVITWLLPTTETIPGKFDPSTYIIGPEEDLPRPMQCFEFVMHAPSGYFHDKMSPYPTQRVGPELGYIWTNLGPEVRRLPPRDQIYGLRELGSDQTMDKVKVKHEGDRKRKRDPAKERKNNKKEKMSSKKKLAVETIQRDKTKDKVSAKEKTVPGKEKAFVKEAKNLRMESRTEARSGSDKDTKSQTKDKVVTLAVGRSRRERGKTKPKQTG